MKAELLDNVRQLSVAERIELAEAIWDTVAEDAGLDELSVSEEHRRELDARLDDLSAAPEAGSPWEEVRSRLERSR